MTSGSSDITPTHTIPTQSAAVKLIKNLKINNATHRHFYFLSAPEGTSKNQNSQHPAAKRSTSPNNLVQISFTGKTQTFFIFQKTFLNQMIDESNNYQLGLDFFYRQNSDNFSYFRKHFLKQMTDESTQTDFSFLFHWKIFHLIIITLSSS